MCKGCNFLTNKRGNTKSSLDRAWEFGAHMKWRMNYLTCVNCMFPLDQDPCVLAAQAVVDKMKEETPGWIPKTTLRSSDGEVSVEPQTTKHLSKAAFSDKSEDKPSDADEKGFHFDFNRLDPAKLWEIARAANEQNILSGNTKGPVELACEFAANMKGTTPEEEHRKFNTKMNYLASVNIDTPLGQDPWVLTCQAIADMRKEKTPGGIPKTTKNKVNYLAVADMIVGKTPEEIRKTFNIKNDFTPEEEEKLRRKYAWALRN